MITPSISNKNKSLSEPADSSLGFTNVPSSENQVELSISGKIPDWVNGVLFRTGSGIYNILLDNGDTFHVDHPFDSLAMIHRFEICGETQTIRYNSRHTSHSVEKRISQRDPTLIKFGPDPCKTIFGKMQSIYQNITNVKANQKRQEEDSEYEIINVTITPNFPLEESVEKELNIARGEALAVKHDINAVQIIDSKTLKPLKITSYSRYSKELDGPLSASHHQFDAETKEYVNFVLKLGPFPTYQVFSTTYNLPSVDPNLKLPAPKTKIFQPVWRHLGAWKTLEAIKPSYIHSFSMTKNYIIIPNYPCYFSFNGLSILYYSSAYQSLTWDATSHTLFHVLDRFTGNHVATYEADPCFSFHSVNSWEEETISPGGKTERVIYMDYCMYDNTDIIEASFELGNQPKGKLNLDNIQPASYLNNEKKKQIKPVELRRYQLRNVPISQPKDEEYKPSWLGSPLFSFTKFNKRRVASYTTIGYDLEMPCINQKYNLKAYRYCWGICSSSFGSSSSYSAVINGLIKLDLNNPYPGSNIDEKSSAMIWDKPGCSCSEPIFIPNPDAKAEDDGVILSTVNHKDDEGKESFFIIILDAATMEEICRSSVGSFNAFTLHGSFVDNTGRGVTIN